MDTAAFADWFAGIGRLNATQRRRAVREPELVGAVDLIESSAPAPVAPDEAGAAPSAVTTIASDVERGLVP